MDLCDRSSLSKAQTNPATGRVMPESLEDAKPKVQADLRTVLPPPAPDAENTWDWGIWQTVADKLEADLINLEGGTGEPTSRGARAFREDARTI